MFSVIILAELANAIMSLYYFGYLNSLNIEQGETGHTMCRCLTSVDIREVL